MAQYRGTIQGGRGMASRLGHKTSGLHLHARTWHGSISVDLFWHKEKEADWAEVILEAGDGITRCLYRGPVATYQHPRRGTRIPLHDKKPIVD